VSLYQSGTLPFGATYPVEITGTLGSIQHQVGLSLATQVSSFQVTSITGSAIAHNNRQEVQVTHTISAGVTPTSCSTLDPNVSCRVVSSGSGTVTLGITANPDAVHGTRVLSLNGGAATAHLAIADYGGGGSAPDVEVAAGSSTSIDVEVPDDPCYIDGPCSFGTAGGQDWIWGDGDGGSIEVYFAPPAGTPPGDYTYSINFCSGYLDWLEEEGEDSCTVEGSVTVDPAAPPAPSITLSGPPGVPLNAANTFQLSVTGTSATQTVQLTISLVQGTGAAVFQGGNSSAITVSVPAGSNGVSVALTGTRVSSTANNLTLNAAIPGVASSQATFTVVGVTISLNTQGQPAADDGARSTFLAGSKGLGPGIMQLPTPTSPQYCGVGVELVGVVSPSNYTGLVTLRRRWPSNGATGGAFKNQTQYATFTAGADDTSFPNGLDNDPQSGGSGGKVYDIDAPGVGLPTADIYRYRSNFVEYAVLGDRTTTAKASADFSYFVRASCTQDAQGNLMLSNDVANDNQAGSGTSPTTWNLQQ